MPDTPPDIRDAATVMPLRQTDAGLEVFMVRRHGDSAFMANRYVYPGGKLDADDCTDEAAEHVSGMTPAEARDRLDEEIEPLTALGLFLAGVRETFEEAGLLLARRRGEDRFIDLVSNPETAERYAEARRQLAAGDLAISEFADREDLIIPLDEVGYFAHWITPEREDRRYDTRFFVVLAPEHQEPLHDERETTDSGWVRPADIIDQNRAGDLQLAPPTLRTLQQLSDFETAESALDFARTHHPPTLLPHMLIGEEVFLVLPGDPEYPDDLAPDPDAEPEVTRLKMRELGVWE